MEDYKSLIDIINNDIDLDEWRDFIADNEDEITDIDEILKTKGDYFPNHDDIFHAFRLTPPNDIRIVIVGQDPYHSIEGGEPIAMGLSFSVREGFIIPPSLRNIHKELKTCIPDYVLPKHGDLTHWAKQGIFLLNQCLTVTPNKPDSHKSIWTGFIQRVIEEIQNRHKNCIYLLMGKKAGDIKEYMYNSITISEKNHPHDQSKRNEKDQQSVIKQLINNSIIIECAHPSPFSAHTGFFGSSVFRTINEILEIRGTPLIKW